MSTTTTRDKSAETIDMTALEAELRPKTSEELRFIFHDSYHGAARLIARAAMCVKLLQERDEKMTGVPMVGTFRRIAAGQILPELVWKFIESKNRTIVERLPIPDQERIIRDPMVVVVETKATGGFDKRKVDLTTAPKDVASLVVGPDGIRTVEEQMAHLGAEKASHWRPAPKDQEEDIKEALTHRLEIRLTDSEWQAVRIEAANANTNERAIVRRYLIKSGLFKRPRS